MDAFPAARRAEAPDEEERYGRENGRPGHGREAHQEADGDPGRTVGVAQGFATVAQSAALLKGVGANSERIGVDWRWVEPYRDDYRWTKVDALYTAARAAGISILDGVHLDLNDDEGFATACQQGVDLGFDGKTLIHPKTIDAANQVFAPSEEELEWSRRIIEAHAEAEKEGKGVVLVDGRLVENLHVEGAKRMVSMAEAIESMNQAAE